MLNQVSPELIVTTLFGSGLLLTTLKDSIETGKFAQRLNDLETKVDKLEEKVDAKIDKLDSKLEQAFRYLNTRIDGLTYYITGVKTTRQ